MYRVIATHLIKKAGFSCRTAHTGAVTLIQRFGSALNLNIHLICMDARMPRVHGCAGAAQLKTPYRDGTTHVIFQPLDFIARLAALVPKPRVNLTRFARIIPDTRPLRGPAKAVQIHSR